MLANRLPAMVLPHASSCMSCQGRKFGTFDQLFTGYPV